MTPVITHALTFWGGVLIGFAIASIFAAASWADREMEQIDREAQPWRFNDDDQSEF